MLPVELEPMGVEGRLFSAAPEAGATTLSLVIDAIGRVRYRLERANCLFHPATLMLPRAAQ